MATANSRVEGNMQVTGQIAAASILYPLGSIENEDVQANAGIEATKVIHQFPVRYSQAEGSDVASATIPVHLVYGVTAEIVRVEVMSPTAPAGGDKQFTVDVKAGNNNDAFASVLSAVVTYDSTLSDKEIAVGVLSTTALADGDALQVVVAATGSTGTQAQGLIVVVWLREKPA